MSEAITPGARVAINGGPLYKFWAGEQGTVVDLKPSLLNGYEFAVRMDNPGLGTFCLNADEAAIMSDVEPCSDPSALVGPCPIHDQGCS